PPSACWSWPPSLTARPVAGTVMPPASSYRAVATDGRRVAATAATGPHRSPGFTPTSTPHARMWTIATPRDRAGRTHGAERGGPLPAAVAGTRDRGDFQVRCG